MNELLLKTFYLSGTYECEAHAKQLLENPIINMKNFKKLCEFNPYLVQNIILEHEKMKYFEIRKKLESERLEHDLLFYLEAYKDKIDSDFEKFEGYKMISKELLSEVLGENIPKVNSVIEVTNCETVLNYGKPCGCCNESINIHELAHKCKDWAFDKGYVIFSSVQLTGWAVFIQTEKDGIIASFDGVETEAIFKACEWIMEQIKGE